MAYINATRSADFGFAGRMSALLKTVKEAVRRRRVYTQTVRELNALSSRELNDLGIHRSMITRIALEAAYGN